MTPLQQHQSVIKLARNQLRLFHQAGQGIDAYYDWLTQIEQDDRDLAVLLHDALADPALTLRPKQEMPPGDWYVWLLRPGRAFGKNHAASIAINQLAEFGFPGKQGLIVGATIKDVRSTIFGGTSGLENLSRPGFRPTYVEHNSEIRWPNGSKAAVRSGDNPQDIRGLSVPWCYCDELIKWQGGEKAWRNVQLCVREGDVPRIIATSTPLRGSEWLQKLEELPNTVVTRGSSLENKNLPPTYFDSHKGLDSKSYAEEVLGEWVSDNGELWTRKQLDRVIVRNNVPMEEFLPGCSTRWIGVDPCDGGRDLCGMSLQAYRDGVKWIMADLTPQKTMKLGVWLEVLRQHVDRFLQQGDTIVVEVDGFKGVDTTLQREFPNHYVVGVTSSGKSKGKRAERAQQLYERDEVRHYQAMPLLEKQMMEFYDVEASNSESPDRVDALSMGLNWITDNPPALPFVFDMGAQSPAAW